MLITALVVANVLLLALAIAMGVNVHRVRRAKRRERAERAEREAREARARRAAEWRAGEIRQVRIEEFDPVFAPDALGPTLATEVAFIGTGNIPVPGGTSDFEAWVLAVLAKRATLMFEFGTCTGKTTYLWARNLPPEGTVYTLTLAPHQVALYSHADGDSAEAVQRAHEESAFTRFRYSGSDVEHKVVQLYGDSKAFDEGPLAGRCDVVFVDGSHAYSYVRSDSEKALRMVKPGGVVLWHDYGGPDHVPDVERALNELAHTVPLVHIAGTTLVAYHKPTES